jgi:hypothetical protein
LELFGQNDPSLRIERRRPVEWLHRLLDWAFMEFTSLGLLKPVVYIDHPRSLDEIKDRI